MSDIKASVERYIELKAMVKEANTEMEALADVIKAASNVDDKYDTEVATVTYQPGKVSYKYSPALVALEKQVKDEKKVEEQTGVAEASVGEPYLVVKFK